ncbi:MAG: VWA domain-containing protein, partial [Planctomycetota bacterium]|nr:VWA domain-containing protein [Planctomycetota bacterium]
YGLSTAGLGEGPSFFGLGRGALHARKICYVVDRSGSMVDELDYVKEEVMRSINRLHRVQQFHVIFFSGGPPIEAPPKKFVHAIKNYKKQAFEFLSTIEAGGSTEPSKAMSRAIRLGADLIYFLTDGEFAPTLVEQLKKWNKDQKVRIYTIAFLRRNGEDLLRQIARQNGGEFRFVSEDDLD